MRWLAPTLVVLALAAPAHSDTWHITPDGTGDAPDLQAALEAAADGDEIVLADGVFSGPGNRDVSFLGKAVVVRSLSSNAEACIVDCGGSPGDPHRGFLFVSGEGLGSALERITIRNGHVVGESADGMGGGAICVGSSPRLTGVRFVSNTAHNGGGFACRESSYPLVEGCYFVANRAETYDGDGGGIHCFGASSPVIRDCVFLDNEAVSWGGGIFVYRDCSPLLEGCTFYGNGATHGGGVTSYENCVTRLERTIVAGSVEGGAMACLFGGSFEIECSVFFGNLDSQPLGWGSCDAASLQGEALVADPVFCDPTFGDLRISTLSPCAPDNSDGCGLIGALPEACGPSSVYEMSWGHVKAGYR